VIVGTCGFPRSRREVYRSLDAVELQETFYNLPNEQRMENLAREAPEGFVFTVKVFQGITHPAGSPTYRRTRGFKPGEGHGLLRPTRENLELWDLFRRLVAPLKPRIYVFQTPPSMRADLLREALEFFQVYRRRGGLRLGAAGGGSDREGSRRGAGRRRRLPGRRSPQEGSA